MGFENVLYTDMGIIIQVMHWEGFCQIWLGEMNISIYTCMTNWTEAQHEI